MNDEGSSSSKRGGQKHDAREEGSRVEEIVHKGHCGSTHPWVANEQCVATQPGSTIPEDGDATGLAATPDVLPSKNGKPAHLAERKSHSKHVRARPPKETKDEVVAIAKKDEDEDGDGVPLAAATAKDVQEAAKLDPLLDVFPDGPSTSDAKRAKIGAATVAPVVAAARLAEAQARVASKNDRAWHDRREQLAHAVHECARARACVSMGVCAVGMCTWACARGGSGRVGCRVARRCVIDVRCVVPVWLVHDGQANSSCSPQEQNQWNFTSVAKGVRSSTAS